MYSEWVLGFLVDNFKFTFPSFTENTIAADQTEVNEDSKGLKLVRADNFVNSRLWRYSYDVDSYSLCPLPPLRTYICSSTNSSLPP